MIDASLYPEFPAAPGLSSLEERSDYVQRVFAAWDFGIPPEEATIELLQCWRDAFDAFVLRRSPAYHAFRALYGWSAMEREAPLTEERWERMDALAGRPRDPFADVM